METSASFEARYAPLLYPTNQVVFEICGYIHEAKRNLIVTSHFGYFFSVSINPLRHSKFLSAAQTDIC
jgi:hypothetical protein